MGIPFQNIVPFIGVVQNEKDPISTLNRVKVRCYGIHPPVHDQNVTSEMLPWAFVLDPTLGGGVRTNAYKAGEWVFGFFLDGRDCQSPIVIGSIPGMNQGVTGNPWADTGALRHADYNPVCSALGGPGAERNAATLQPQPADPETKVEPAQSTESGTPPEATTNEAKPFDISISRESEDKLDTIRQFLSGQVDEYIFRELPLEDQPRLPELPPLPQTTPIQDQS